MAPRKGHSKEPPTDPKAAMSAVLLPKKRKSDARPRGKPFQKGNRAAEAHWYKPGQSGNPDGRPSNKPFTQYAKWLAAQPLPDELCAMQRLPTGTTWGQAAIAGGFRAAMMGDAGAWKAIRETFEGPLAQVFRLTGGDGEPLEAPNFTVNFVKSTITPETMALPEQPALPAAPTLASEVPGESKIKPHREDCMCVICEAKRKAGDGAK